MSVCKESISPGYKQWTPVSNWQPESFGHTESSVKIKCQLSEQASFVGDVQGLLLIICGEQDKYFYSGQLELASLLDSAKVESKFVKYPNLGHGFPDDFKLQIDQGLIFILDAK